jgi:hypothetical protein
MLDALCSMGVGYVEGEANKTICDVPMAAFDGGNGAHWSLLNPANLWALLRIHRTVVLDSLGIDDNHINLLSCADISSGRDVT